MRELFQGGLMKSLKRWILQRLNTLMFFTGIQELHDIILESKYQEILRNSNNPLLIGTYYPGFSQVDEDSIIQNISCRIYAMEQNTAGGVESLLN